MNTIHYNKNTVISRVRPLSLEVRYIGRAFVAPIMVVLLFLAMWMAIPNVVEAGISSVVSNVSPGWSNNRKRVVFYNGSRFFLLYSKGDGSIYYKSSPDNVDWSSSGESTLTGISSTSLFDIYLVSDTKFDLVYYITSSQTRYVRTCTISGATITVGDPSSGITDSQASIAVARSGAGEGTIYVISTNVSGDTIWVCSANNTGDAANVTAWPKEVTITKAHTNVAIVPYQGADKVLVVYTKDPGGTGSDGVYSRVITAGGGAGTEVKIFDFDSLPDFSSPVSISDTDFRIIIRPPGAAMEEWKWDGSAWSNVETVDAEVDQDTPSLFYDRISGDMYAFSVDTGTDDVERHKKPSGGSWQTEVVADDGEAGTHSFPITQMHESPYGSARIGPRALVWAYRVGSGPYDLKVGALGLAPKISSGSDQVFQVG